MTLAAERWPAYAEPAAPERRSSVWVVYRAELLKISRLIQVRVMAGLAVIGPFLAVAVLHVQSATPGDTAFGQWVHSSGLAIPMVVLVASLHTRASCQRGGTPATPQNGSGNWLCLITYQVAGPGYPVIAKYKVDVQTDGCYAADGDGPASVNGSPTITGPHYQQVTNPLALIDGCFDIA